MTTWLSVARVLAPVAIVLATTSSLASGCGSSGQAGFADADGGAGGSSGGGGGGPGSGASDGATFGDAVPGGGGGPLACKGLVDGQKSSSGCEYYVVVPDVTIGGNGACFAAFLANTSNDTVSITLDYGGQPLDASKFAYVPTGSGHSLSYTPLPGGKLSAGEVAILFLNRAPGLPLPGLNLDCPKGVTAAITSGDAATHGTGIAKAFHVITSSAVVAYDMYPFGGGQSAMTSATLLLPVTSWDTNYVTVDAYGSGLGAQAFVQIVAAQDGTEVKLSAVADVVGGAGVAPAKKGVPQSYMLSRGQVLQLAQDASLAGSVVQTNRPVGVWGGKQVLAIDSCCDETAHQQIPPVRALGSEYVGLRYRNRYDGQEETPPWRLVGAADGTVLTWEPSPPAGAPTALDLGTVKELRAAGPFVVRSQDEKHPFYMSAHMTGAAQYDPNQTDGRGDAEFVNVVPPGEYLPSYVFFTDPTYPETNLLLVRTKGANGFADVTLDCAGKVGGWSPVGTGGAYEFTRVDLVRHDFAPQGGCNNGRHEIHSDAPFGLTVWGWGSAETGGNLSPGYSQYVSYAYPGGASVQPINPVVIPPPVR